MKRLSRCPPASAFIAKLASAIHKLERRWRAQRIVQPAIEQPYNCAAQLALLQGLRWMYKHPLCPWTHMALELMGQGAAHAVATASWTLRAIPGPCPSRAQKVCLQAHCVVANVPEGALAILLSAMRARVRDGRKHAELTLHKSPRAPRLQRGASPTSRLAGTTESLGRISPPTQDLPWSLGRARARGARSSRGRAAPKRIRPEIGNTLPGS